MGNYSSYRHQFSTGESSGKNAVKSLPLLSLTWQQGRWTAVDPNGTILLKESRSRVIHNNVYE